MASTRGVCNIYNESSINHNDFFIQKMLCKLSLVGKYTKLPSRP